MSMRFCIVIVLCYLYEVFAEQCKEGEHAISGMMLRGHTFRKVRSLIAFECHQACYNDFRCHSFNYVISEELCELNNRTKEARPENFVPNSERFYVRSNKKRVPLGSIPEFPAETCREIKASEEGKANSGNYWLDTIIEGKTVLVPCDMETADADECKASLPVCDTNAICQNTPDSYICACKPGVIADGRTCTAVLSCEALGVEDPNIIPDVQITASSNYLSYYPHKGRLNGDSGWCQQSSRITDDYIQVDIGAGRTICGVATQGKANGSFIKSYRLSSSTDGTSWTAYEEQNVEKIFEANSDLNTIIKHTLNNPVQARYIRFYPVTFSQYPCMRIEVFVQ